MRGGSTARRACVAAGLAAVASLVTSATAAQGVRVGRHDVWDKELTGARARLEVGDPVGAVPKLLRALEEAAYFPDGDPRQAQTLEAIDQLPTLYLRAGRLADAERALAALRDEVVRARGPDTPLGLEVLYRLLRVQMELQHVEGIRASAEELSERAVRILGPGHPLAIHAARARAVLKLADGQLDAALGIADRAVEDARLALGPQHEAYASALQTRSRAHEMRGETQQAAADLEQAVQVNESREGPASVAVASMRIELGRLHYQLGKNAAARRDLESAIAAFDAAGADVHPALPVAFTLLAKLHDRAGNTDQAAATAQRALRAGEALHGKQAPELIGALTALCDYELQRGHALDAERHLKRAIQIARQRLGPDYAEAKGLIAQMGRVHAASGRLTTAESLLRRGLAASRTTNGSDALETATQADWLAAFLADRERWDEALPLAREAVAWLDAHPGAGGDLGFESRYTLARIEAALHGDEAALPFYQSALASAEEVLGADSRRMLPLLTGYEAVLARLGRGEELAGVVSRRVGLTKERQRPELEPALMVSEEFNFRFASPGPGWSTQPVDARKSAAALALSLRDPPLGFVLVPEKLPAGRTFTLGEALGIFKANLKGRMGPAFRLSSEQQRPVGGLPGTELIFLAGSREAPLRYVSWSTLHGSYFYTLYTWGDARIPRAKLLHQARRLASKFSILEEERAPEPPLFQSAKFGYSVDLEGSPLRPSEALRSNLPYAEFTASDDATIGMAVFPVSRLSLDPDPGLALSALEHFLQLRGPLRTAESTQDGRRVLEREYRTRSQGVRFVYRVRLYGGEPLILAMVWSGAEPEESLPERLALLDRVRVGPSQSEPARVEGLSAEERTRHAFFLTALGAAESERGNFAQAIRSFALAQELAPDDAGIRQLVVGLQLQMGRYDAVLQTTDEALSRSPDDAKLHAFRGMARLNTGDTAGALEDLARSQELGFEDEGVFEQYVALLLQQGRAEEAETRLDERIARTRSPRLRKDRAVVRRSLGKFEESIAELEALLERDPGNHELALELAASHLEAGDGQKALELTQPLVDAGWPSAQLHFVRARAQFQLGRYTEATAALERAIERDPALPGATEFRDLLSAALGEGDNRLVRNPIEPVPPLAAASRSTAAAEAPPEGAAEFGAYYLSKSTGVRYERDAEYRSTTRWVARVVGRKGIERVSSAQFAFDPVLEEIFVNDLTVRGPDGEVATRGRPSDYYVLDPSDTSFVTHKKTLHVAIRGVEVGSTVELTVTTRRKAALDRFDFVAYLFSDLVPVLHSEFYVLGDIGELAAVESGGVERAEVEGALVWRREQPPVVRIEPLQQSPMRYLPALWVGDRDASWEAVGREYLETIAERLEPSEDAAALAARTAGDAGTPREQALRLAGYAQSHLQYRGVAFGRRAYVPNPVDRILEAKAGDCKDHALLLYHLLRAQGIRSELALVSLSQPVQTEIPSLAQFDHLVVRCEECGGLRFLDTTDKDFRLGSGVPRYLGGRWALVLDPERPHLEQIPEPRLDQNELSLQRTVRVSDGGGAEVEEHLLMGGASGAWARGALRQVERDQWREVFLHGSFGTADGLRFHSLEAEGIEDATRPVALDLSYELSRRFTASGDRLVGRLPALWEHLILDVVPVEPRTAPFRIETPLRLAVTVRLEGPSRFSLSDPPGATEATGRIVRWRRTVEPAKDLLVLRYDIARESGLYPADAYAGYQREVKGLLADLEAVVAFHREPPRSPPLP